MSDFWAGFAIGGFGAVALVVAGYLAVTIIRGIRGLR